MTDATALRTTLLQTENTLPSIQAASRSMMKFYDRPAGPELAVSEWRAVLQTCQSAKTLPLLYVANEVLQTSKRNRGNKFLEAFSPVLGSSLIHICKKDRSIVEKVRRTVKVWGDRSIFSMRFVMDVLAGLNSFRGEGGESTIMGGIDSVPTKVSAKVANSPNLTPVSNDDDNEDDIFGGSTAKMLDLDIKVDSAALSEEAKMQSSLELGSGAKRRRSSTIPLSNTKSSVTSGQPAAKKPKALSNQAFIDMFQNILNLDDKYKSSFSVLKSIPLNYLKVDGEDIDDLVGDELTDMYKKVCETHRRVRRERHMMYSVAADRRKCEKEAKRYIRWLKNLIQVDDDDLEFSERLETRLDAISICHGKSPMIRQSLFHSICTKIRTIICISYLSEEAKALRNTRRETEARKLAQEEAAAHREAEEDERRRMLEDVKKQAEAKPGMVWNPQLRDYQYLHDPTQESWRD